MQCHDHLDHLLNLLYIVSNLDLDLFSKEEERWSESFWVGIDFGAMNPGRCAACKYLRRKCPPDCIFSPYFPSNNPQRFISVHRLYGASNVAKLLQQLPTHLRAVAADSLYFEAQCRDEDTVYGCVGRIYLLQQQIHYAESQLAKTQAQIAVLKSQTQRPQSQQVELQSDFNDFLQEQEQFHINFSINQTSSGFM